MQNSENQKGPFKNPAMDTLKTDQDINRAYNEKLEAMEILSNGLAHDFNNFLSGIVGYSEVALLKAEGNSEIKSIINKILETCDRAKSLISQTLIYSNPNYPADGTELIRADQTVNEFSTLLAASLPNNIELRKIVSGNTGFIHASPDIMNQVLMNLCTNSIQAMEDTGGVLSIRLETADINEDNSHRFNDIAIGRYLRLTVSDTGTGIPENIMHKIFDPYFTTRKKGEGKGLGLAAVWGIIKKYRGTILVHSIAGKETSFDILIPTVDI